MKDVTHHLSVLFSRSIINSLGGLKNWFDPAKDASALYEKEDFVWQKKEKNPEQLPFFVKKWGWR